MSVPFSISFLFVGSLGFHAAFELAKLSQRVEDLENSAAPSKEVEDIK